MRLWPGVVLLAGCRSILGIETDVAVDPAAGNDEDVDGTTDIRDNCPTVHNPSQVDDDKDGVGNACDPELGIANTIAFFSPMLDDRGIATTVVVHDGFAQVDSGFSISLEEEFKPVRIEAAVQFNSFNANDQLGIEIDVGSNLQWTCFAVIKATACGNIDCLQIKLPSQGLVSRAYDRTSLIDKLVLDTGRDGAARCTGVADPEQPNTTSQGTIVSTGFVRFHATNARLYSLIIYE